jgi:RNA polymerase sigma factor (TIGR02999 family)
VADRQIFQMDEEQYPDCHKEIDALIPLAYQELRYIARRRVAQLGPGATLSPTDLVNEVLLRLLKQAEREYNGKEHLIRVAATAMHNVLVDRARRRLAAKRGGDAERIAFDDDLPIAAPVQSMLVLDEALTRLQAASQQHFELVMLKVYAGLTLDDIARQRGVSTRTLEREWSYVKAVLHKELKDDLSTCGGVWEG